MPEPIKLDFIKIYPKDFIDQDSRPIHHPRTDPVYSSSAGRDAALRGQYGHTTTSTGFGVSGPRPKLSLVTPSIRHEPPGDV